MTHKQTLALLTTTGQLLARAYGTDWWRVDHTEAEAAAQTKWSNNRNNLIRITEVALIHFCARPDSTHWNGVLECRTSMLSEHLAALPQDRTFDAFCERTGTRI